MIKIFNIKNKEISLKIERFSSNYIFIYLNEEKNIIIYGNNLKELLNSEFLPKKFKVNYKSISILLTTGLIPPPYTVYQNLFKISQGIECKLFAINEEVKISFSEKNIFTQSLNRTDFDETKFLEMLYSNIDKNLDPTVPTYLFQSAGKDSNIIALAYSIHCENKNSLTCLTYSSSDDETIYAKDICKKLGFKHITLSVPKYTINKFINLTADKFKNTIFPNTDNAYLGYFLYNDGFLDHRSNLIDGMGNDIYSGHIPSLKEYMMQYLSILFSKLNFISNYTDSILLNEIVKDREFYTGLYGLPNFVSKKIFLKFSDQKEFLKKKYNTNDDYLTIRAKIRGGLVDYEKFMGKLESFAFSNNSNVIFPFANSNVGNYVFNTSQKLLYSKIFLKNKIYLRKIIDNNLNINIDQIGKKSFRFNYWENISSYEKFVFNEILICKLFEKNNIEELLKKLKRISNLKSFAKNRCRNLLNYLFQIALWYNHSDFIDKDI